MSHNDVKTVLVIDDEIHVSNAIKKYLDKHGYTVIVAHNGAEGLEFVKTEKPAIVIADIHMSVISGLEFLDKLRDFNKAIPVIITTGDPNMDIVMETIHNGAQDYLVKPFLMETLLAKMEQVLQTVQSHGREYLLSELVAIHSIASKLAQSTKLDEILNITFDACFDAIDAETGYIMLMDRNGEKLSLERVSGEYHGSEITNIAVNDEWTLAKWVLKNNRSLLIIDGKPIPNHDIGFPIDSMGIELVVPIRSGDHATGIISISRSEKLSGGGEVELNLLEVLAAQAGAALSNAGLYKTLNQRILDLNFISDYAEQFVGIVTPKSVVTSFIDTIKSYFDIDYVGVLIVGKRFHKLHYWSRYAYPTTIQHQITQESVDCFNGSSEQDIKVARVSWVPVTEDDESETFDGEFEFTKAIPLVWGEFKFGAFILKWAKKSEKIEENVKLLRGIINQTRIALTNAKLFSDIKENYIRTIKALAIAVDAKDTYTHGHSENVMRFSEILASHIGMSKEDVASIRDGGLLHDIGKIGIPGYILNKPGPLTNDEFNGVMKTHPTLGANIVKEVPFLVDLNPIILYHHENFDGTGYPLGLKGNEIPLGAQIVHVADAFEAMTSNRPYRKSLGKKEAVIRLRGACGTQFDTKMVESFIDAMVNAGEIDRMEVA